MSGAQGRVDALVLACICSVIKAVKKTIKDQSNEPLPLLPSFQLHQLHVHLLDPTPTSTPHTVRMTTYTTCICGSDLEDGFMVWKCKSTNTHLSYFVNNCLSHNLLLHTHIDMLRRVRHLDARTLRLHHQKLCHRDRPLLLPTL